MHFLAPPASELTPHSLSLRQTCQVIPHDAAQFVGP
jgi:hypothetical protein